MNEITPFPDKGVPVDNGVRPQFPPRHSRGRLAVSLIVLLLLAGTLGYGFWQHYQLHAEVIATAEARRDAVPTVRTAVIKASAPVRSVTWPGTTEAFEQANINARASGYISKRNVDIGSRVKAGELPVAITAPEGQHHIAHGGGTRAAV